MTASAVLQSSVATASLKDHVDRALEYLSNMLLAPEKERAGAEPEHVQNLIRFLGQVAAGWAHVPDEAFPHVGAGFGSTVEVEYLDRRQRETYTLMTGPLLDIENGDVSLASAVGQALLGAHAGDVIDVRTPRSVRRMRVISVRTLEDRLREDVPRRLAA